MTENWTDIGGLADIPPAGGRVVNTPAGRLAVFRTALDEVYVLDDRCPHRGGPLSQGMVHGRQVQCPMHGLNVDLETGEAVAPDEGCVKRFPVKVEGGRILLLVEAGEPARGAA